MSYTITIFGHGPEDDDVRGEFEEAVRGMRSVTPAGGTLGATLTAGGATYDQDDVSDEPGDDADEGAVPQAADGESEEDA